MHGITRNDFFLVHGDLVSSIRIDDIMRAHKERRRTKKNVIIAKESGARNGTRYEGCLVHSTRG